MVGEMSDDLYWLPPRASLAPRPDNKAIQVGIIGAGIGGLVAAIALLESGHQVEIYERSQFKDEVGAAIMAPPNSSRILAYYGVDFERSQATVAENTIIYPVQGDLKEKRLAPVTDFVAKYRAPWCFFHRVDLHNELRRLAIEPTPTRSNAAQLHLATTVSKLSLDGTIYFDDGTTVKKDLVIAADGIRAAFLPTVIGRNVAPDHYMSMLRFMVPTEELGTNPETLALFEDGYPSLRIAYGSHRSVVFYGCRRGALQNVGVLYPPELSKDADGNEMSGKEDVVSEIVKGYPEAIQAICRHGKRVGQWPLYKRKPLERFARGRVVLIGDAAHPMPPTRAQGASMALEDAVALGVLLSDMASEDEVPARLDLFNALRVPRVAVTQIISSMHQWDPSQVPEDEVHYFGGKVLETPEELERFSCANNVLRDAYKLLSAHKQEERTPCAFVE